MSITVWCRLGGCDDKKLIKGMTEQTEQRGQREEGCKRRRKGERVLRYGTERESKEIQSKGRVASIVNHIMVLKRWTEEEITSSSIDVL